MGKKIISDFFAKDSYEMPKCSSDKHAIMFTLGRTIDAKCRLEAINDKKNFRIKDHNIYLKPHKEIFLDFRLWAGLPKGYIMQLEIVPLHMYKDLVITSNNILQGQADFETKVFVSIYNKSSKTIKINMLAPTLMGKYYKCSMKPLEITDINAASGSSYETFQSQVQDDNFHLLKSKIKIC